MVPISRYALLMLTLMGTLAVPLALAANTPASQVISTSLCGIITNIQAVVGIIALALFILGGAFYAVAHMLPAAGNLKGNLQGWSLGMIVGGIVGLLIVIIAPHIISLIAGAGGLSASNVSCA